MIIDYLKSNLSKMKQDKADNTTVSVEYRACLYSKYVHVPEACHACLLYLSRYAAKHAVCMNIYICMSIYAYTCMHSYLGAYLSICLSIYLSIYLYNIIYIYVRNNASIMSGLCRLHVCFLLV